MKTTLIALAATLAATGAFAHPGMGAHWHGSETALLALAVAILGAFILRRLVKA